MARQLGVVDEGLADLRCEMAAASWTLVAAAQRGDREAFGQLYCRYLPVIAGYVRRRVRDRCLAEDLTSETFTRAWRSVGTVREQGRDVGAWLVTIARNLVRDHVKSHRVQREITVADVTEWISATSGVEQVVLVRQAAVELARRVAALPADQREVIWLRFGQEWSARQIAAVLDRSEGAVRALQHRALTRLRQDPAMSWRPVLRPAAGGER